MASDDVEAGLYRNTNTGVTFAVQVRGDDVAIFQNGREITRINKINFWFNTKDATGPTYKKVS